MRKNKFLFILVGVLALSGCGFFSSMSDKLVELNVRKIDRKDNRLEYEITCSGRGEGNTRCYERALEICGKPGFQVIRQNQSFIPTKGNTPHGNTSKGIYRTNYLTVLCNEVELGEVLEKKLWPEPGSNDK